MNRGGGQHYGPASQGGGRGGRGRDYCGRGRGGRGGRGRGARGGRGRRGRGGRNNVQHNSKMNGANYVHNIGTTGTPSSTSFNVAVQGCSHGELDSIFDAVIAYRSEKLTDTPAKDIDVLLCCGDVQTLRNTADFHSISVPDKYKAIGDFHAYYSGQKIAPILTIMIGGNHESSNYLQELYYGGWVAPNIYYLGAAGVVNVCKRITTPEGSTNISSLRIAGNSGIYQAGHYTLGRYEMPPYNRGDLRSVYHTREVEVKRLQALATTPSINGDRTVDIMLSHDWPRGIYHHGNLDQLLKRKPFFKEEIKRNDLGSPANELLLHTLKPRLWFSAHLHTKFEAVVKHQQRTDTENETKAEDPDEIDLDEDNDDGEKDVATVSAPAETMNTEFHGMESNDGVCPAGSNMESLTEQMTRFLSLDKCLPKRRHIQIAHVEASSSPRSVPPAATHDSTATWLEYDASWLAIMQRTHKWTEQTRNRVVLPDIMPITDVEIKNAIGAMEHKMEIPRNFAVTVAPFDTNSNPNRAYGPPQGMVGNPQTDSFLNALGLDHRITVPFDMTTHQPPAGSQSSFFQRARPHPPKPVVPSAVIRSNAKVEDSNEIDLNEADSPGDDATEVEEKASTTGNPEEIELDESDGDTAIDEEAETKVGEAFQQKLAHDRNVEEKRAAKRRLKREREKEARKKREKNKKLGAVGDGAVAVGGAVIEEEFEYTPIADLGLSAEPFQAKSRTNN